ncbi:hypothetical protein LG329_02515 [Virgibacillus necropolis]|uniref:hypothetical protein n=1 Tax=Virgibacillus necropolis TaxID=163877 RepID=UPI00384EA51A
MKKYLALAIFFILSISFVFLYQVKINSIPSISFFPLDEETSFTEAQTNLEMKQTNQKEHTIAWNSLSKSEKSIYLRQDVSLLFNNGKLRGALSEWHENEDTIDLSESIPIQGTSYFQTISYHHGEIHYPNGSIKSIQQMTYDELYVIENDSSGIHSFQKPKTKSDVKWEKKLRGKTSQTLLYHWNKLLNHYQINEDDYLIVPLTELNRFNTNPLPSLSQAKTNQVIGLLWEGLYKNYIVPITYEKKQVTNYVPLILFGNDNKHLLVLFEVNGKKERLIQQYP